MASTRDFEKLARLRDELAGLKATYNRVLAAQSWETGDGQNSRRVTNVSLSSLSAEIRKKEKEIEYLEEICEGYSASPVLVNVGSKF